MQWKTESANNTSKPIHTYTLINVAETALLIEPNPQKKMGTTDHKWS